MFRKGHVRFLGGKGMVTFVTYPTEEKHLIGIDRKGWGNERYLG